MVVLFIYLLFINTPDIQLVLVCLQRSLNFLGLSSLLTGAPKECKMKCARWKVHPVQKEESRPFIFVNTFLPRGTK